MKAAEWRKRIRECYPVGLNRGVSYDLLGDFEAAEAERDRWMGQSDIDVHEGMAWFHRAKAAEAQAAALLDDAHRLSERCVAAEEERNVAEARAERERRHRYEDVERLRNWHEGIAGLVDALSDIRTEREAAEVRAQAEQQRREAAEERVRELEDALMWRPPCAPRGKEDRDEA